jgi:hypothetical protein
MKSIFSIPGIKKMQANNNFMLWYPNYCSNKSLQLMTNCIKGINFFQATFNTDKDFV